MELFVVVALFTLLGILGRLIGVDSRVPGGWIPPNPAARSGPTRRGRPTARPEPCCNTD